jgi:protein-tyrosine-phosphatase
LSTKTGEEENMSMKRYNILFLCTHNSARSILGEIVATTFGGGRFVGFSAGSTPSGVVNPFAVEIAGELGYPVEQLRSKSWDEFAHPDAPKIDIVITVCDAAATEVCPVWVGMPVVGHWGFKDPSGVLGDDYLKRAAFLEVMGGLKARIERLAKMPLEDLECAELRHAIGELERL